MAFLKEGGKLPPSKCMRVWYLAGRKRGWIFFLMRFNGQTCDLGSERLRLMALLHNACALQNTPYVTVWDWRTAFPRPCKLNCLLTVKKKKKIPSNFAQAAGGVAPQCSWQDGVGCLSRWFVPLRIIRLAKTWQHGPQNWIWNGTRGEGIVDFKKNK